MPITTKRVCLFSVPYRTTLLLSNGIMACARKVGPWRVEVHPPPAGSVVQWLRNRGYSGIIAAGQSEAVLHKLAQLPCPLVAVFSRKMEKIPVVVHDDRAIGALGATHLSGNGHRHLAFFGIEGAWSIQRYEGFARQTQHLKLSLHANQTSTGRWPGWAAAFRESLIRKWLKSLPRPVGIMACDDHTCRTVADIAIEMGLQIPQDLAILGVNNDELTCEAGAVELTSIDTDREQMGYQAAMLLHQLMIGRPVSLNPVGVPGRVVVRQSTSMFTYSDPDISNAMRLMHAHLEDAISVDAICKKLSVSRRQFERRFHSLVGRSPGEQIQQMRIERAKALLRETNLQLVDIAVRCGYGHTSSFVTAFRRLTGTTPAEFRSTSGRHNGHRPDLRT